MINTFKIHQYNLDIYGNVVNYHKVNKKILNYLEKLQAYVFQIKTYKKNLLLQQPLH